MANNFGDSSNATVRAFLSNILQIKTGDFKKLIRYNKNKHKNEILSCFNNKCVYCNIELNESNYNIDHLIPINKDYAGLDCLGNLVPACKNCNQLRNKKENKCVDWKVFLQGKLTSLEYSQTVMKIEALEGHKDYIKLTETKEYDGLKNSCGRLYVESKANIKKEIDRFTK